MALHESIADGVGDRNEDDRDRACFLQQGTDNWCRGREDDRGLCRNELRSVGCNAVRVAARPPEVEPDILAV
jgi:hypothetical protein